MGIWNRLRRESTESDRGIMDAGPQNVAKRPRLLERHRQRLDKDDHHKKGNGEVNGHFLFDPEMRQLNFQPQVVMRLLMSAMESWSSHRCSKKLL
ncbi:MAG: hypothetical protein A4E65_01522 [Syntrophorhabdus sp. PtaU1.Bin153]|nr:MAG: hypothetical protein A4E65_01522 [Syntrophorhabdus sp. PtaU1.Bin153]